MKRASFASLVYDSKKKKTRREKFLEEMDQVIPWEELLAAVRKYYPKAGNVKTPDTDRKGFHFHSNIPPCP